jgi:hypothetical protein
VKKNTGTHYAEGWVGHKASLKISGEEKYLLPQPGIKAQIIRLTAQSLCQLWYHGNYYDDNYTTVFQTRSKT